MIRKVISYSLRPEVIEAVNARATVENRTASRLVETLLIRALGIAANTPQPVTARSSSGEPDPHEVRGTPDTPSKEQSEDPSLEERWISVKERFPEEGQRVLAWGLNWSAVGEVLYGTADDYDPDNLIAEDRANEVLWRWYQDAAPVRGQSVTHWMPLPSPPTISLEEPNS